MNRIRSAGVPGAPVSGSSGKGTKPAARNSSSKAASSTEEQTKDASRTTEYSDELMHQAA